MAQQSTANMRRFLGPFNPISIESPTACRHRCAIRSRLKIMISTRSLLSFTLCFSLLTACGGGGSSVPPTVVAPDTAAPVITLNGDASVQLNEGEAYEEQGATAQDNVDGSVDVVVSGEVGSEPGVYTITYTATDAAGNSSQTTREVTVLAVDTMPPLITLLGEDSVEITTEQTFNDPGATATDDTDGTIDVVVSGAVGSEPGVYALTYSATDAAGNSSQVNRTVTVVAAQFDLFSASATEIVEAMTLAQKVGQMIQPEIAYVTPEEITEYGIGSVLNGGGSHPNGNRAATPEEWLAYARSLRAASLETSPSSLGVPIIWGTDAVHGHNNVRGATIFPHNIGLGAINDPQLIGEIAVATAREVAATGIDWTFAPTLAQAKDYRWGRTYESYSDDPDLVEAYGRAMVEGIEGEGLAATAKHFIGDGGTTAGRDQGNTELSTAELLAQHGSGYTGAFDAAVDTVMATFNSVNGVKVHGSKFLLTDVLRGQLGFDGMIISDWNGIGQVQACSDTSCAQAINAGIDMVMVPTQWRAFRNNLINQIETGQVSETRIDEAVTRIIELKQKLGLIDRNFDPARQPVEVVGSAAHREIAREAVRRSQVLLKNNGQVLPLRPNQRILLVGSAADSVPLQAGGWSVTWQGTGTTNADFPGATTIRDAFADAVEAAGGTLDYSATGSFTTTPDAVVVVLSEQPYAEGNGDLQDLDWGDSGVLSQVQGLRDSGIPVITLLMSGRPMFINPELNLSDAFVASWLPGTEATGIADVLLTNIQGNAVYNMTGRLSFSWPGGAINPANAEAPVAAALFDRGYGLSYSDTQNLPTLTEDPNNTESGIVEDSGSGGGTGGGNPNADPFWVFKNGSFNDAFDLGVRGYDEAIQYGLCINDGGFKCPSISWSLVNDVDRAEVFEVFHEPNSVAAAVFVESSNPLDLTDYQRGRFVFDLKHVEGPNNYWVKLDCFYAEGCFSNFINVQVAPGDDWQTIELPVSLFTNSGLNLARVNTGIVIAGSDHNGTRFRIDNVRFEAE
jgi:beta-glucosidase